MLKEKLAQIKAAEEKKAQIVANAKKQASQVLIEAQQRLALKKRELKEELEAEKKRRYEVVQKELEQETANLEHQALWQIEQLNEKAKQKKAALLKKMVADFLQAEFLQG
jgi:vacuolar-type H+-ATPase subunit H